MALPPEKKLAGANESGGMSPGNLSLGNLRENAVVDRFSPTGSDQEAAPSVLETREDADDEGGVIWETIRSL